MNRYVTFEQATEDALRYTCRYLGLNLSHAACSTLCKAHLRLQPFKEVPDALRELRRRRLKLAALSNGSPHSIRALAGNACLRAQLDHLLSGGPGRVATP